jgi:D-arabinitol dehydrogenase (NADP+)
LAPQAARSDTVEGVRAIVYDAPGTFAVRDVPVPEPGQDQVRVRVIQTGVCRTDLHLHDGQFMATYPMTPGHETVGTVAAIGDGVDGLQSDQQVVVNPNSSCGHCAYCREGRPLLCVSLSGIGSTLPGGFAEFVIAPASQVFDAEGIDPDVAVFTEPTACATHAIERLRPAPGSTALVVGAGPSGVLLAQLIGRAGAARVTVAARSAAKLETARALGIDRTVQLDRADPTASIAGLRDPSGSDGYDIVVDATGNPRVAESCVPLARNGGTVLLYGVADEGDQIRIAPYDVFRRELTILGSMAEIDTFPAALAALRSGRVRTDGLITHRLGLGEYGQALDLLREGGAAHKIVIVP